MDINSSPLLVFQPETRSITCSPSPKFNLLNWGTTKSKDHLDLPCYRGDIKTSPLLVYPPEARSITCSQSPKETQLGYHQQQRALLALLILAQMKLAKLKQGAIPARTCQKKLTPLVYHKKQGAFLLCSHLMTETPSTCLQP